MSTFVPRPSRTYFGPVFFASDLEFCRLSNPEISQSECESLLDELFLELVEEVVRVYPQVPALTKSCIVDLDSSTSNKFSRHWIVHLPGDFLFSNAGEVGTFVRSFVGRLAEEIGTGVLKEKRPFLAEGLFVRAKGRTAEEDASGKTHENTTCFVDLGVYTRNRLFRLMGATKYGKPSSAALRIAYANEFEFPNGFGNEKFYAPDMEKVKEESKGNEEKLGHRKKKMVREIGSDFPTNTKAIAQNPIFFVLIL